MISTLRYSKAICIGGQNTAQILSPKTSPTIATIMRTFNQSRGRVETHAFRRSQTKRLTLKEALLKPMTDTPFAIGRGAIAGGALFGIGALCIYGYNISSNANIYTQSMIWPQYVRDRVHTTYAYFGSGLAITAASAATMYRSATLMRLLGRNTWPAILLTLGAMIGTGILAQSIEYREGFGAKQMAWALHCGVVGAVIAPLCIVGGPLILKAAFYTAGIVSGLTAVAACAPSDKFLTMGGPLAIGLGVVFAASLGSMFLPPTTALGASLYSMSLYGGLLLFSAFLLYDTQRIVRKAQTHPQYAMRPYDPINASISIYLDTINIFVRLLVILSGGGRKR